MVEGTSIYKSMIKCIGSMHENINSHVIQPEHVQTIKVCHMEMSEGNTFKMKICSRFGQFSY